MIGFKATILKFGKQGEKTGWTYIEISENIAATLNPGKKTSFRVKGRLDNFQFRQIALLPMGGGVFIMALRAEVLKVLGKRTGHILDVEMAKDDSPFEFSEDFLTCLHDEPTAIRFFSTLPLSHQKYFSKWIDSAKTDETKTRRIVMSVEALKRKLGYAEMIRENKKRVTVIK